MLCNHPHQDTALPEIVRCRPSTEHVCRAPEGKLPETLKTGRRRFFWQGGIQSRGSPEGHVGGTA